MKYFIISILLFISTFAVEEQVIKELQNKSDRQSRQTKKLNIQHQYTSFSSI